MKKFLIALLLAFCAGSFALAQETTPIWDHGDNVSDMTYENYRILKILDQKESYVVLYEKKGVEVGQAVVPKSWYKEVPRKLDFRHKPGQLNPYMTVLNKGGEFYKVILTVPVSKRDSLWGFIPSSTKVEGTDAASLELK